MVVQFTVSFFNSLSLFLILAAGDKGGVYESDNSLSDDFPVPTTNEVVLQLRKSSVADVVPEEIPESWDPLVVLSTSINDGVLVESMAVALVVEATEVRGLLKMKLGMSRRLRTCGKERRH
ncbi:hypothetical protein JTE90_002809 [Oedothorax gibbosus]|uniref:Uncharacterized protein n=1 Tax=Oedothorax gibbosus TaxID=931172 RepID=A0AAV6U0T5_9ARAC|nr:hypothetical protein JTE90_002809 [Oedothorax gibbosus]